MDGPFESSLVLPKDSKWNCIAVLARPLEGKNSENALGEVLYTEC